MTARSGRCRAGRAGGYAAVLAAAALLLSACGGGSDPAPTAGAPASGSVTVLAAASLTEPLTDLADAYQRDHPGVDVRTSFGSSTTLAQQVANGAPADLYLSAGTTALQQVPADERPADRITTVARNVLEIAVPSDNPAHVSSIADLSRSDVSVVLCVAAAPCGAAADAVLAKAGVQAHVVSRETDVKATLAKVRLGEVDAAVVYHSDVVSSRGEVEGVQIPQAENETLTYPMLQLTGTPAARAFADYITSSAGRAALERHGFLPP